MPTGTSRYWNQDKSLFGMPAGLAAIARKNLATVDKSISAFNDRAKFLGAPHIAASRPATMPGSTPPNSAFQFSLNGNLSEQLTLSGNQPAQQQAEQPAAQNWRFNSFVNDRAKAYTTNPAAYKTSPAAYAQVSSPIEYQPRNTDEEKKQYGWGSGIDDED